MDSAKEDASRGHEAWYVTGASVQGHAHIQYGRGCEDAHHYRTDAGGLLIAGVADGAGSANLAATGAKLAVATAVDLLARELRVGARPQCASDWTRTLMGAAFRARSAIMQESAQRKVDPRELATTLLLLVATPIWTAALQIGDGVIVATGPDDAIRPITLPSDREYVNDTTFLTSDDAMERPQCVVRQVPIQRAALLSDGLQRVALRMPGFHPHRPFFAPLFKYAEDCAANGAPADELAPFLRSPQITEKCDDDLTLVLAVRADGVEHGI